MCPKTKWCRGHSTPHHVDRGGKTYIIPHYTNPALPRQPALHPSLPKNGGTSPRNPQHYARDPRSIPEEPTPTPHHVEPDGKSYIMIQSTTTALCHTTLHYTPLCCRMAEPLRETRSILLGNLGASLQTPTLHHITLTEAGKPTLYYTTQTPRCHATLHYTPLCRRMAELLRETHSILPGTLGASPRNRTLHHITLIQPENPTL